MKKSKIKKQIKTILGFLVAALSLILVSIWMMSETAQVTQENTYVVKGKIENISYRTIPQRADQINFSIDDHNLTLTWRDGEKEGYKVVNRLAQQTESVCATVWPGSISLRLWGKSQAISIYTPNEVYGDIDAYNQRQRKDRIFGTIALGIFWCIFFLVLAFYITLIFRKYSIKRQRKRRKNTK